jgi:uncharacterized protein (DUF1330 family)
VPDARQTIGLFVGPCPFWDVPFDETSTAYSLPISVRLIIFLTTASALAGSYLGHGWTRSLRNRSLSMGKLFGLAAAATLCLVLSSAGSTVAEEERPAFVIVERTATTGSETIQQEYAKLAREILPKYAARYLARSQENTLLEGDGVAPCCMAILQFPNMDAVKRWYDSAENQEASKVRQSGARFRIIAIQGLPPAK